METPLLKRKERPDWVWVLLIFYGFATLINFALILLALLFAKSGQLDWVGIGIAVAGILLRIIGLVRLFFFKADAWLYLALALFIFVANAALDWILGGTDFFLQRHSIPQMLGSIVTTTAITIYAFNLLHKDKSREA